jgi:hypothetical protein
MPMPERDLEDRLLREDLYALENRLDSMEEKLSCLPTQCDLTRTVLLALLTAAAIVLFGIEAFVRQSL